MKKETIVITGGAGGIGSTCAKALKEYNLVISDYSKEAVEKTVLDLNNAGYQACGFPCDITEKTSVDSLRKYAHELGKFKGIIHTAGVSGTIGDPKKVFTINLAATAIVIESFYEIAGEKSVILLLSSMMGHTVPANPVYDAALRNPQQENAYRVIEPFISNDADTMYNFSKRGVMLLCKDNAMRFGKKGARVVTISPGVILTPMAKKALEEHPEKMKEMLAINPSGRNGLPEDIANLAKFLFSDESGFINGTDILIDGGVLTQLLK